MGRGLIARTIAMVAVVAVVLFTLANPPAARADNHIPPDPFLPFFGGAVSPSTASTALRALGTP